jgi:hypothetical protein
MFRAFKYSLERWNFKKNKFYASVVSRGIVNLQEIIINEGIPLTEKQINYTISTIGKSIQEYLREGISIKIDDYFTIQPVIRGVFNGSDDQFDPRRHSIEVVALPGYTFRKLNNNRLVKIKKVNGCRR